MFSSDPVPPLQVWPWTKEEDDLLLDHVRLHGTRKWKELVESGKLPKRNTKACCNRFRRLRIMQAAAARDPAAASTSRPISSASLWARARSMGSEHELYSLADEVNCADDVANCADDVANPEESESEGPLRSSSLSGAAAGAEEERASFSSEVLLRGDPRPVRPSASLASVDTQTLLRLLSSLGANSTVGGNTFALGGNSSSSGAGPGQQQRSGRTVAPPGQHSPPPPPPPPQESSAVDPSAVDLTTLALPCAGLQPCSEVGPGRASRPFPPSSSPSPAPLVKAAAVSGASPATAPSQGTRQEPPALCFGRASSQGRQEGGRQPLPRDAVAVSGAAQQQRGSLGQSDAPVSRVMSAATAAVFEEQLRSALMSALSEEANPDGGVSVPWDTQRGSVPRGGRPEMTEGEANPVSSAGGVAEPREPQGGPGSVHLEPQGGSGPWDVQRGSTPGGLQGGPVPWDVQAERPEMAEEGALLRRSTSVVRRPRMADLDLEEWLAMEAALDAAALQHQQQLNHRQPQHHRQAQLHRHPQHHLQPQVHLQPQSQPQSYPQRRQAQTQPRPLRQAHQQGGPMAVTLECPAAPVQPVKEHSLLRGPAAPVVTTGADAQQAAVRLQPAQSLHLQPAQALHLQPAQSVQDHTLLGLLGVAGQLPSPDAQQGLAGGQRAGGHASQGAGAAAQAQAQDWSLVQELAAKCSPDTVQQLQQLLALVQQGGAALQGLGQENQEGGGGFKEGPQPHSGDMGAATAAAAAGGAGAHYPSELLPSMARAKTAPGGAIGRGGISFGEDMCPPPVGLPQTRTLPLSSGGLSRPAASPHLLQSYRHCLTREAQSEASDTTQSQAPGVDSKSLYEVWQMDDFPEETHHTQVGAASVDAHGLSDAESREKPSAVDARGPGTVGRLATAVSQLTKDLQRHQIQQPALLSTPERNHLLSVGGPGGGGLGFPRSASTPSGEQQESQEQQELRLLQHQLQQQQQQQQRQHGHGHGHQGGGQLSMMPVRSATAPRSGDTPCAAVRSAAALAWADDFQCTVFDLPRDGSVFDLPRDGSSVWHEGFAKQEQEDVPFTPATYFDYQVPLSGQVNPRERSPKAARVALRPSSLQGARGFDSEGAGSHEPLGTAAILAAAGGGESGRGDRADSQADAALYRILASSLQERLKGEAEEGQEELESGSAMPSSRKRKLLPRVHDAHAFP